MLGLFGKMTYMLGLCEIINLKVIMYFLFPKEGAL